MSASDFARHGARPTEFETYPEVAYNHRITDIQAAIGLAQLDRLDEMLATRRTAAERYTAGLADHPFILAPFVPEGLQHNWQSYQVTLAPDAPLSRNAVMDRLFDANVPTRRGVMASHREPPYAGLHAVLPITERVADATLQLPMHSGLTASQTERVLEQLWQLT